MSEAVTDAVANFLKDARKGKGCERKVILITVPWVKNLPDLLRAFDEWNGPTSVRLKKKWIDGFTEIKLVKHEGVSSFPSLVVYDGRRTVHALCESEGLTSVQRLVGVLNSLA